MTIGRTIAGRYELIERIGGGGMATIFRARDRRLERDVAIKLIRPELGEDPQFAARFAQEARRLASFSHPHIVAVHDYGADNNTQFIVMELVGGSDLAGQIRRRGMLEPNRAAAIAGEVAGALQAAHRRGIVHRDVKPANILLTRAGSVKLADLGIAQAADDAGHTTTGQTLGSVEYFSPEQARGEPVGPQTDVYALGVVLYEMLTGRRPFGGDSPAAIALSRLSADPADPRSIVPDLPPGLVAIALRAMAREPEGRYRSAGGMRVALQRWQARTGANAGAGGPDEIEHGELPQRSVVAPPPLPPNAAGRKRRSRPGWALPAAALLLLAATGFLGQRWLSGMSSGADPDPAVGVLESPSPESLATPTLVPATATVAPTSQPTPMPATPPPATPAPATPPPATPPPTTPPSQAPQGDIAALSAPESVTRFYSLVADGMFDDAYALWSDRMKSTYPRKANLDDRFADTARITVHRMDLLSQGSNRAVVGIDFTETYDSGSWRRFDGSWELVLVGGRWLLDAPHF